jgi:uncharacterized protein
MKKMNPAIFIAAGLVIAGALTLSGVFKDDDTQSPAQVQNTTSTNQQKSETTYDPFSIQGIRAKEYDSNLTIEQDLGDKGKFRSYIISYPSDGFKVRALMNVPDSPKPPNGFPVLFLNHGFIEPTTYSTLNSYKAFADAYSNAGYLVLKPDYRGHDDSEGAPISAHISPDYLTDVLNLLEAIKKYPDADKNKIAMWGHSMGGGITLRAMVVSPDIKAVILVAGVVASPQKFYDYWLVNKDTRSIPSWIRTTGDTIINNYKTPSENPDYWNSISPYPFLSDITMPVAIHHGTADNSVPKEFSDELNDALGKLNKEVEYFVYPGGDHNLAGSSRGPLLTRTIEFLNKRLK